MMYVPEAFRVVDPQLIEQLVADHGFATLYARAVPHHEKSQETIRSVAPGH